MLGLNRKVTRGFAHARPGRRTAVGLLVLALGLSAAAPAAAGEASVASGRASAGAQQRAAVVAPPPPVTPTINAAKTTLATAQTRLKQGQYSQALASLSTLRTQLAAAHNLGMHPLRAARAIAVLNLEHTVLLTLLPSFNGLTRATVVSSLQRTVGTAIMFRTAMLTAIVKLPAAGAGAAFDDGMADTLPDYGAEARKYTAALQQFQLTAAARTALTADLAQIRINQTQVRKRFGGGE